MLFENEYCHIVMHKYSLKVSQKWQYLERISTYH